MGQSYLTESDPLKWFEAIDPEIYTLRDNTQNGIDFELDLPNSTGNGKINWSFQ
jgi:hypothetical protein